jgi:alpha-beta hydrolase superfamily lysophospholipase
MADKMASQPRPAATYAEAATRFEELSARDDSGANPVNPLCRSQLLTHGEKVERAIVLVHGIPNCPQQYAKLGPLFHERGLSVLIPRMPHHGYADRATHDLRLLTTEELRAFADETTDIACGLGEQVIYLGLSAGGILATWVAQFRADVAKAVVIAPALNVAHVPARLNGALIATMNTLPDRYLKRSEAAMAVTPPYVYYGQSSRAVGQLMRFGAYATRAARTSTPAAQSILVVTSAFDTVVDNVTIYTLVNRWRAHNARNLTTYEFPLDQHIVHDMIDPVRGDQQVDKVYPVLLDLILPAMAS